MSMSAPATAGYSATAHSKTSTTVSRPALAALAVLAVVAVAVGAHVVLHRRSVDLSQAAAARTATAHYDAQAAAGRVAESHAKSLEAKLAAGKVVLPDRRGQAEIINDLASLAARTGVAWTDGSQASVSSVPGPTDGLTPFTLTVSVQGGLHQVLAFVSGVSRMPRAASPSSLVFSWQSGSMVKANLSVIAYSQGSSGPTTGVSGTPINAAGAA